MSIVSCHECNGKVSTEAKTCPHCGAPVPSRPWNSISEEGPQRAAKTKVEAAAIRARRNLLGRVRAFGGRLVGRSPVRAEPTQGVRPTKRSTIGRLKKIDHEEHKEREGWKQKAIFWFWIWIVSAIPPVATFFGFFGVVSQTSNRLRPGLAAFGLHLVVTLLCAVVGLFAFLRMIYCLVKK